ncbi:MAG TPA: ion channel [Sedimentisphaerales bacterium]|nr:ion channel [Sedimentisphaerales bacterium]
MNKHKTNWLSRFTFVLLLLLYSIQSATIFHHQDGVARYVTLGFIVVGTLGLNYTIIKSIFSIFKSRQPIKQLYKEYLWVFGIALLNICMFASFYQMFGICSDGERIKGDWYNSLYFSIVTWTTLGYGDFSPVACLRFVAALEAVMGYIYMALLVGLLLNLSHHSMD